MILTFLCIWFAFAGISRARDAALQVPQALPQSPTDSLRCIQVRPGFQVELVAAEPLVVDPIALAWGPDAKLWVVEMGDYPQGNGSSSGRIRYLEDADGDERYERSNVFLDGLKFPTGVLPWRQGVLVTCAPDIFYATDSDGDGKADRRTVLFTGFSLGNPQHRVNGLRWGLDNWIHCANGDSGGNVLSLKTGRLIDTRGHDFRIQPDDGLLELLTGMSQFGRCRDDWGNWFGGHSDWPFWHSVLDERYLSRNRYFKAPEACAHLMHPPANAPVFPISRAAVPRNEPTEANVLTSACGAAVYRDELFGPAFSQSYFVCEPEHNLVHHEVMHASGVTFSSERPPHEQTAEFLASCDVWFRPTQVQTGPDGALWIVDMYRLVIEHPEWMRPKRQGRLDLRAGDDKGRIYRVYPAGKRPRTMSRLDRMDIRQLVAAMDSPNGPQRDMAQQLLFERRETAASAHLELLVTQSKRATSRLTALCTLEGLSVVPPEILERALVDPHPAIRRAAIRICEPRLDRERRLQEAVLKCVDDPDCQVRLQLAFSLGQWHDRRAGQALARIAAKDAEDRFIVAAVMSSAATHPDQILERMFRVPKIGPPQLAFIKDLLRLAIYTDREHLLAMSLRRVAQPADGKYSAWQFELLAGVLDVLDYGGTSLAETRATAGRELKSAIDSLADVFRAARAVASDREQPLELRVCAARLLGRGLAEHGADVRLLEDLLISQIPGELQCAAVQALGNLDRADVPGILLKNWSSHGPDLQTQILDVLLSRARWTLTLLEQCESQHVPLGSIGAAQRSKLILYYSAEVRQRTAALLDSSLQTDRQRLIEHYQGALELAGNVRRGEMLFREHCSTCHRFTEARADLGPDLRALSDRSPQVLLVSLLDPSRSVEPRYQAYYAMTLDGRIFTGILTSESGASITLTGPEGQRHVLLRAELQQLHSTGQSMMPDGLEKLIPASQDLADLIAYLRSETFDRSKQ